MFDSVRFCHNYSFLLRFFKCNAIVQNAINSTNNCPASILLTFKFFNSFIAILYHSSEEIFSLLHDEDLVVLTNIIIS